MSNYNLGKIIPSRTTLKVLNSTFHTLAFVTTFLRLLHRFRRRRLGWDDMWAGIADLFAIIVFTLFLLSDVIFNHVPPLTTTAISVQSFGIVGTLVFYMLGLWCSKISIAVTIVRLLGDGPFRTAAKGVALAFGMAGIALSLGRVFRCGKDFSQPPFCPTPRYTAYVELVSDMLGDTWLIGAPLYMLKRLRLPRQHQRLISSVFLCGLLTTCASILHNVFILTSQVLVVGLTAHIQLCVSIITCNLLVLATYIYRKVHDRSEETTERTATIEPSSNGQGRFATQLTPVAPRGTRDLEARGISQSGVSYGEAPPSVPVGSYSTHVTLTDLGSSMLHGLNSTFNNSGSSYPTRLGGDGTTPRSIPDSHPTPIKKSRFKLWF